MAVIFFQSSPEESGGAGPSASDGLLVLRLLLLLRCVAAGNAPAAGSSFNQKTCSKVKQITIVFDASNDLCDYSIQEETFV